MLPRVERVARADAEVGVLEGEHVWRIVEVVFRRQHHRARQERADGVHRHGGHRRLGDAGLRRELDDTRRAAAAFGEARLAVDVDQLELVAGIDEVGVLDLRVGLPQLRPAPGSERNLPEMPQRVSPFCTV